METERRTHALGLVYPPAGADRDYTGMQLTFIGIIAEYAARHDYDLLLSPSGTESDASFRRMVGGRRVDGVIVLEVRRDDDRVDHLLKASLPFVTMGRNRRSDEMSWVDLDFAGLAAGCVRHLCDLGHERIAFVNRSEQLFRIGYGPSRFGQEGFTKAMAELGLTGNTYQCGDDFASGESCLEQILRDDPDTSSLVTMNEAALGGLYLGLIRNGRSVPRDFSVVGVVAGTWAERVTPALTAAEVPARDMCRVSVELMVERLASPGAPPRHVLLRPLISLRASTGPFRPAPGHEPGPDDLDDLDF
ncbi:LacI family DNA-binding transcriptional regulator [Streptomyces sp. NBC_01262]|uniref:LacI family DNA-binding transcriptional regulator n=1 Tax=Streptomyces sp. NBC_01262 TaxID=2903803 RepID=UPI002E33D207|nr:substrate-binding domain-containing protein [Streptomyces sp. NBC_01262]